ncbi:MAG TPA: DNA cytosine methyltransferase, partial [Thermoanaerobaculia bacterium]|nr:DNA cytosine methyltransferase [Thermoanaerobaculia bacterium]
MRKPQSTALRPIPSTHLPPVLVDYYCGGGGFTCGALGVGVTVACGIDCDERARSTYVENNRNGNGQSVPFVRARVEELTPRAVAKHLAVYPGHPTIFVGCPPCQPFTNIRTTKTHATSTKEALRAFIDHVEALHPDFIVVENVPGIRAPKYGLVWEESIERLNHGGYNVRCEMVNAARYGVPQKRVRTLLVACKAEWGDVPWPKETHTPETYRTVRTAFGEATLCKLGAGETCKADPLHGASALSALNLKRIRAIKTPGGSRTAWPVRLWLDCYRDHDGH